MEHFRAEMRAAKRIYEECVELSEDDDGNVKHVVFLQDEAAEIIASLLNAPRPAEAALAAEVERLQKEIKRLSQPQWFWDQDDARSYDSPTEAIFDNLADGDIMSLQHCTCIDWRYYTRFGDDEFDFTTEAEAEAFVAERRAALAHQKQEG